MEEMMKVLKQIQEDLAAQKQEMKNMQECITQEINNNINEKFGNIENRTNNLEIKLNQQQEKIDQMERQLRKKNLIVFGLEETEQGYAGLQELFLTTLKQVMEIAIHPSEIEMVRRLGKKGSKTRPIVVTLTTMGRKWEILKKKYLLKGSTINIKEDFPQEVLLQRKKLQEEVERERALGKNAVLRYDKIVILKGSPKNSRTSTRKHKRFLTESPESQNTMNGNSSVQVKQMHKKNKTKDITHYMTASLNNTAEINKTVVNPTKND